MSVKTDVTELVVAAQSGDINAFNELYNQSAPDLKYVGYSILHKKEDVEDALQETYITIYRSFSGQGISPIHDPEKFQPWARQIMRNTCLNLIDHQKRKAGKDDLRPMTSEDGQLGMDKIDNYDEDLDFSPVDAVETEYVRALLNDAISEIPAIRQTCLALHQQGLKYREIGEKLDLPEGTVKSHVRYAKAQLKKIIKEIEDEEGVQLHGVVLLRGPRGFQALVRAYSKPSWISAELKKDGKIPKTKKVSIAQVGKRMLSAAMAMVMAASTFVFIPLQDPKVVPNTPVVAVAQDMGKSGYKKENSGRLLANSKAPQLEEKNEFYNPKATIVGTGIQVIPYHVWYKGNKMYADCYLVNMESSTVTNLNVNQIKISTSEGVIADASFGAIKDLALKPKEYITHRFVFRKGTFKEADLTKGIQYNAETSWFSSADEDEQEDSAQDKEFYIDQDKISAPTSVKPTPAPEESQIKQVEKQSSSEDQTAQKEVAGQPASTLEA